jgi:hypothetical protein
MDPQSHTTVYGTSAATWQRRIVVYYVRALRKTGLVSVADDICTDACPDTSPLPMQVPTEAISFSGCGVAHLLAAAAGTPESWHTATFKANAVRWLPSLTVHSLVDHISL